MKSIEVRERLIDALLLDLVGPFPGSPHEAETIPQFPSRWYLTGFLIPAGATTRHSEDEADANADQLDLQVESGGGDDAVPPEPPSARRANLPSSIGLSVLLPREATALQVTARWGDYRAAHTGQDEPARPDSALRDWSRTQRVETLTLDLPPATSHPIETPVPNSGGLVISLSVRPVHGSASNAIPAGARSISVFLVNRRPPADDEVKDEAYVFQAELVVDSAVPFIPRESGVGAGSQDPDDRIADLQYRDAREIAVGHGIATEVCCDAGGVCHSLRTRWIPSAEVERVAPYAIPGVETRMDALAGLANGEQARAALTGIVAAYREWIARQRASVENLAAHRQEIARDLIANAAIVADRIESGIVTLATDPQALDAFRIANRAMAEAGRRRRALERHCRPDEVEPPQWRSFQLAFVLMNLRGIVDPAHADREIVDLLFFPTGGGKTEAYLGLAAFTLVLRRLRRPDASSAGVAVLMRYTLRLLTLDQLGRAATLICALERERERAPERLGPWPFEIGLWVGRAATPNRMGRKGDNDPNTARAKTIRFMHDDRKPSPIPIEECPWCGERFRRNSFQLWPSTDQPTELRVNCLSRDCDFSRGRSLPILGVDEPIYRRLPCFMIATVDKFAAMPWTGPVGNFFGGADHADVHGFYGPCDPAGTGKRLPQPLAPPELIIQDELHLISGPMGTMVGLYETALDALCTREIDGHRIRPKIVASTATVRRAGKQIRALFDRHTVEVFPPPGPDRRDSFFAYTESTATSPARLYLGIAAQGRTPKVILLRTYLALLGAGQQAWLEAGGALGSAGGTGDPGSASSAAGGALGAAAINPADPYMTLLGYFNSLRELGGSRRIVEDEVTSRLMHYAERRRVGEPTGLFADRKIAYDVVELTSRVPTNEVAEARRRLGLDFTAKDHVDVAIATNMISVGLDIPRLGLMVVLGQPKTTAEYIQATSRVGRDPSRPGLIVTLFNIHRPRDRSHYERFGAYHQSFYRSVEATSVTPFSPRALDRGLAGTLVALARLGRGPMTPPHGAERIIDERANLEFAIQALERRGADIAGEDHARAERLRQRVRERAADLLDAWVRIAQRLREAGARLQYNEGESSGAKPLLRDFLAASLEEVGPLERRFRANRSMRDVEPSVNLWMRSLDGDEVDDPGGDGTDNDAGEGIA